jgi:hypothetical protein
VVRSVVTEWATRRRPAEKTDTENLQHPGPNDRAAYVTIGRDRLFRKRKRSRSPRSRPAFPRFSKRELTAVRAAIALPWSNGQTEGQITRLKLVLWPRQTRPASRATDRRE